MRQFNPLPITLVNEGRTTIVMERGEMVTAGLIIMGILATWVVGRWFFSDGK